MIKKINILLVICFLFILIGCQKENDELDDQTEVDITELPYYEYLNDNNPTITIEVKDFGTMVAQLFPLVAENTVNNIINYINDNEFNGSTFHRVINDFMIQGGIVSNTKPPIYGEFTANGFSNPLNHYKGVLSMARTNNPNTATSQIFIVHKNSPHLNGLYAAFGGLISGFSVLDRIATVDTDYNDAPIKKVVIESITIQLNGYNSKDVVYFN